MLLCCHHEVHPVLAEKVVCAAISPHMYMHTCIQVQCYMPLIKSWSLLCNDNYCWKGSSDIGLLTQQKCCFIPSVLVKDNKMPVVATSAASEQRLCVLSRLFICVVQIVCVIKTVCIIIIMYIYHALINTLSAHMMHIKLNTIFYTHVEHLPKQFT